MKFYKEHKNGRLICLLCSHYCKLKDGQIGICGVNKRENDEIQCLVYGHIDAINVDPIEKKPLYHFLPSTKSLSLGTVGCNFKCDFCQNWQLSQRHNFSQKQYFSPQDIVNLALQYQCDSISYTYNEPTIFYPYAKDIALEAKKHNIKNVFVTNGFESQEILEDMYGVIDALNIDLKSFDKNYYKKVLKGELEVVLENIKKAYKLGLHIEITTLIVPTQNDNEAQIRNIINFIQSLDKNIPWHISAFHPNYKQTALPPTSTETLQKVYDMAKNAQLHHVYMGNIGAENPTICPNCNEILIKRQYFGITKNNLQNGTCPKCATKLQGVFYANSYGKRSFLPLR